MKVHFGTGGRWRPACASPHQVTQTTDRSKVTCIRCKETVKWTKSP